MISAQTLRVCREGKPVPTFPDHVLVNRRGQLLGDTALAFCRHVNAVGLAQPASKGCLDQTVRLDGPDAAGVQLPADFSAVGCRGRRFIPFIASLPAICRMTILVPEGTALDSRASMPPVVSPLITALLTDIGRPLARRIASSCAGYAADAPTPYPAVLLAPRATICALALVIAPKPTSSKMMIEHLNMCGIPRLAYRHDSQLPVTLSMHAFWAVKDPMAAGMQYAMFMKNVGLLGGALLIAHFGAGPFSLDARRTAPTRVR